MSGRGFQAKAGKKRENGAYDFRRKGHRGAIRLFFEPY